MANDKAGTIIDISEFMNVGETAETDHIHSMARLFDGVTNLVHPIQYTTTEPNTTVDVEESTVTLRGQTNSVTVDYGDLMAVGDHTDYALDGDDLDSKVAESLDNYNDAKGVFLSEPKRGPNGQFLSRTAKEELWETMSAQSGEQLVDADTI